MSAENVERKQLSAAEQARQECIDATCLELSAFDASDFKAPKLAMPKMEVNLDIQTDIAEEKQQQLAALEGKAEAYFQENLPEKGLPQVERIWHSLGKEQYKIFRLLSMDVTSDINQLSISEDTKTALTALTDKAHIDFVDKLAGLPVSRRLDFVKSANHQKTEALMAVRDSIVNPGEKMIVSQFLGEKFMLKAIGQLEQSSITAQSSEKDAYNSIIGTLLDYEEYTLPSHLRVEAEDEFLIGQQATKDAELKKMLEKTGDIENVDQLAEFLVDNFPGYSNLDEAQKQEISRDFFAWKDTELVAVNAESQYLNMKVYGQRAKVFTLIQGSPEDFAKLGVSRPEDLDDPKVLLTIRKQFNGNFGGKFASENDLKIVEQIDILINDYAASGIASEQAVTVTQKTLSLYQAVDVARSDRTAFRENLERGIQASQSGEEWTSDFNAHRTTTDQRIDQAIHTAELDGLVSTGEVDDNDFPIVRTRMASQYKFSIDPDTGEMCDVRVPANYRDKLSSKDPNGACMVSACIDGNMFGSASKIQQEGKEKESAFAGFGEVGSVLFADFNLEISWARTIANAQKKLNEWGEDWSMILGKGIDSSGKVNCIELSKNRVEILDRIKDIGVGDAEGAKEELLA